MLNNDVSSIFERLTWSGYTKAVKQVNTTTKEYCGFEPLKYDYRTEQLPSINEVTKLTKLYEVAMQSQYANDESLNQALLVSGCFSEVNFHTGETKSDAAITSTMAQVTEMLAKRKNRHDSGMLETARLPRW